MSQRGAESPPPETQDDAQIGAPVSDGHGVNSKGTSKDENKSQLEGLSSNPKGPLDDHAKTMTERTEKTEKKGN